ncbi:conserved hypothetical protein [Leishmania mexicana MHOM/GT/2001/U1103]|uniref:Membrane-associated protein n=1 Tax=Leishmania mexicana (strain MHOM/GT/2001/U1103) TaxID=929439 RepID=E9AL99_LEIMU|nr:conserved hypothetical protein [Leishmania mexicana MHOM/GT/2001/U1103]CBZ23702.1 conserved hypothetical protein [Leishmania mexicana MHOM/GT/2001/U1103]
MAPRQQLRAAALFCVLLITGVVCVGVTGVDASSGVVVQTTPAYPLLDVVFLATTSIDPDRTLYISSASDCISRLSPICTQGRAQVGVNYNTTTCIFNVTSASLGLNAATVSSIPALHWCSSATGTTSFSTLQMNAVRMTPGYAYYNTETTFTFNQATPVATKVGLYRDSSCDTLLNDVPLTTLQSSLKLTASIGPRTVTYVCASIPTVFNNATVTAVRSVVYGVSPYDIYTTQGVRHRSVAISASSSFHYMSLSTDPQCLTLAQPYQQTETGDGVLTIKVPRGTYYFCGVVIRGLEGVGVFVPALSTFEVLEYGIQPHTMYAAHATPMSFSLDAVALQSKLQGALFTTADCGVSGNKPVTSWSTSMTWTVGVTGTYYACVRTSGSTLAANVGYVNQVVVSNIPVVSLARQPAISGLGELATVTRSASDDVPAAVVTVGLSTSSNCATLFAGGSTTETGSAASFYVPESSPSSTYYCVSNRLTTDASGGDSSEPTTAVYYPLGPLELRTYGLSYPALRTKAAMNVGLDSDVTFGSGTSICLTPALLPSSSSSSSSSSVDHGTCDAAIAANSDIAMTFQISSLTSTLIPVLFPVAGSWLLCVQEPGVMGSTYMRLRTLRVYGNATVTPDGVILGIPARLAVTAIPPSTTVSLTTDTACSTDMPVVTTTQSSLSGKAALVFTHTAVGNLLLCVGYHGEHMSQGTAAQVMVAGTVASTNARVVPSVAVDSVPTQLTFSARGASSLSGYTALLVPPSTSGRIATACPTSAAGELIQLPISVPPSAPTGTIAVATFTPASSAVGTTYLVCAGAAGKFVSTGTVTVAATPTVTTDPSPPAFGLPAYVTFSRATVSLSHPDTFTVVKATDSCTSDMSIATVLATGSVDTTTGAGQPFVAPTQPRTVTSVRLCVAKKGQLVSSTLGYADAGVIELTNFTSVTRYAQRGRPNTLVGKPILSTATLYLVSCTGAGCGAGNADTACSSTDANKYTTSSHSPLTAPAGTYFLCQSVTVGTTVSVVGSDTTVEVVEPFEMSLSVDPSAIRAYVPFAVTMSGGPGGAGAKYTVVAQPASTACGETAAGSQSFAVGRGTTEITITDMVPVQKIRFCVQPSAADSFEVLTGTLQHYMTPAAVIGDRATTLTSGGVTSGATAVLSRTADCLGVVAGGGAAAIVDARVTFTVASCGANGALASLYYCEAAGGGAYASRGAVGLLRASGCGGGADASIAEVDAAPGAAIGSFGIDAAYLARPRLSASSDCGVLLDAAVASVGYAPGAGERAAFHVCAVLVGDASVTFTTARPTLRVANWAVSPTAAVSRYNATLGAAAASAVRVNYATPSSETFLSTASDCSVRTAGAAGLSGASKTATYSTTGVRGLVHVCTVAPLSGRTLAVAEFLSVTPPAVLRASPAVVRGGEYSATLVVDGAPPLYSMVPGADSGYTHSGYYTSASREVYLSGDACSGVLAGTSAATVTSSGSVSFATAGVAAGVSAVWLCAVTAAGPAVVLAGVAVAPGRVYPTTMVSGALGAPVFIPSLKGTAVQLSASASGCGSVAGMPSFTTDAEGYGTVDLVGGDGGALAPGTYTLCYGGALRGGGGAAALESVELVRASHFDVRGTTFVVGVASRMVLLQDLTAAALVPGFSTARDCTSVSSEHGEWAAVTNTSVSVTATGVYTAGLYLCARAPVNGTLVALPGLWSGRRSVQFVASAMQLPSAGWDACTTYTLDRCYPPGASASGATSVVAVVHGDCCSEASRSAVVGEASMASGTCELTLDYDKVSAYPAESTYHVCVWDSADDSVCTTVSEARVSTSCTRRGGGGRGLSRGALIVIIIGCGVAGIALLCLLFWIVWCCCCRQLAEGADSKPEKGRQLVGLREFGDEDRLVGYVMSGRHPLLYYPSSSARMGRSVSASLGYPSISGSGCGALDEVEDEGRDQIALQEARARYNLRLMFAERLQLLELAEKNAAADAAGMNTTYASGDSYLHGLAQPERRLVESILTETGPMEPAMDLPVRAVGPRHAGANELELAAFEAPEECDISLTADANLSLEKDAITGEHHKVRSRSIESAPRRCLSPVESCWTNEDFEEREEDGDRKVTVESAIPDSELSVRMWPRQDGGDHEELHRVVVRHFTKPALSKSRRSASLNGSHSGGHRRSPTGSGSHGRKQEPHYDPLAVMPVTPKALATSKGLRNYILSPPDGENDSPPDLRTNTVHEVGDITTAESAISRSPIAHAGANDISEEALPAGIARVRSSEAIDGNAKGDASEDDLLSFTTTQRFYDEKRFLLEQEDGRRQRLCNWEEEERAQLAQDELNGYVALSSATAAGGDTVNAFSDHSENNDTEYNAGGGAGKGHYGKATAKHEGEDEQVCHIPAAPTTLPSLPPAPRPQTLQNDYYHVFPTGGTGAS